MYRDSALDLYDRSARTADESTGGLESTKVYFTLKLADRILKFASVYRMEILTRSMPLHGQSKRGITIGLCLSRLLPVALNVLYVISADLQCTFGHETPLSSFNQFIYKLFFILLNCFYH